MPNDWKKYLLQSGLPFEYEVKECFVKNGCSVWDEYKYLKEDENRTEKEFSYDLDANLWNGGYCIDFLIECKYKTEPTKWFFTPDPYAYQNDLSKNSFFHSVDFFTDNTFIFDKYPFDNVIKQALGPFCLKGIEVYKNQSLDVNISKATNQLSYAFVDKLISAIDSQLEDGGVFTNAIFLNIPIIITNANLHIINDGITTIDIENANSIKDISSEHDFLLFHNKIGEDLKKHNLNKLMNYFSQQGEDKFKSRIKSFTDDIGHFINVISKIYCPQMILVMHHDANHRNYKKLFDYINFITVQSTERDKRMTEIQEEMNRMLKKVDDSVSKKKT